MALLAAAAVAGASVAVIPTLASGQGAGASFQAIDTTGIYGASHVWQSSQGGTQATVGQGATVTFSYSSGAAPQGSSMHNVDFTQAPATPACTQTSGASSGSVPPLPHSPTGPDWSGTCTFSVPGTYRFWCDLHMASMTGTVVVQGSGTTGTTQTTGTTGTTGTTPGGTTGTTPGGTPGSPGSGPSSSGSPPATAALGGAAVAATQKGNAVRGSASVGQPGSTLTVDLQAASASLARARGLVSVGHLVRHSVGPGRVSFSVALSPRARRALRRHGRLIVTVKVHVVTPSGAAGSVTRKVTLRR